MRTTVTLDDDVKRLLQDAMHRSGKSFKETLNAALRAGLQEKAVLRDSRPFIVDAHPMGLLPGIDPAGFNRLVDDLEVDAHLEKLS